MKGHINEMSMVNIGDNWGLNILNKLHGILYGPAFSFKLGYDALSDESVGERKNDASSFLPR